MPFTEKNNISLFIQEGGGMAIVTHVKQYMVTFHADEKITYYV